MLMQDINKYLQLDEKIHLVLDNEYDKHEYMSRVENISEDGTIEALIPIYRNRIIYIKNDSIVKVIVSREGAIYEFRAKVVSKIFGVIPLLKLERISDISKIQRRDFYRLKIAKSIKVRKIINLKEKHFDEYVNATAIDISGGGLCFSSTKELDFNDLIEVSIELSGKPITIFCKVLRRGIKDDDESNRFIYGVAYEKITEIERNIIMRFIFEEQRKLAKKGLI
jgi:c-di-GMP-binding flagellar brake protein YcgR